MRGLRLRRSTSTGADVERLLAKVKVEPPDRRGGGLLTEPVIVVRGKHHHDLELLDLEGRRLGSAVPALRENRIWNRAYELRDADNRPVLIARKLDPPAGIREALASRTSSPLERPLWEVSDPNDAKIITVHIPEGGWRQPSRYPVTEGAHQIGTLRRRQVLGWEELWGRRGLLCWVEDELGHALVRILLARKSTGFTQRIALVIEIDDRTPDPLRKVAFATSAIVDRDIISFGH